MIAFVLAAQLRLDFLVPSAARSQARISLVTGPVRSLIIIVGEPLFVVGLSGIMLPPIGLFLGWINLFRDPLSGHSADDSSTGGPRCPANGAPSRRSRSRPRRHSTCNSGRPANSRACARA